MLKIKVETNIFFLINYARTGPLCRVEVSHAMSMASWVFCAGPTFLA
jgi:hypothetical protein